MSSYRALAVYMMSMFTDTGKFQLQPVSPIAKDVERAKNE